MICNCVVILCFLLEITIAEDAEKWVWKSGEKRSSGPRPNEDFSSKANTRYAVYEDEPIGQGQIDFRPPPNFVRPGKPYPQRPEEFGQIGGGGFGHGHRPGVLTGPVPSWVKEPPFKNYDRCKCAERFNCNSPGIAYGQCDAGKQYCCYSSNKEVLGGPLPSRPIHSPENGVLVGPGGPATGNYPGHAPHRPHHRPPYSHFGNIDSDEVLIGPGGPTGILGRPPKRPYGGRPTYSNDYGLLGGPGADFNVPFEDYGPRSRNGGSSNSKKN